jgi:hypothetical protein
MSSEGDNKQSLVLAQSGALSQSGVMFLIRRGTQDLIAKAEADQWLNQGLALWHKQQYREAVECFRRGLQLDPNRGDIQFPLGAAYYRGDGVAERDYTQAAFWYRNAAEQGHAGAANNLAICYKRGQGVPQDLEKAADWFRKAAEQGNILAQFNLGVMYDFGQGVPQDDAEAVFWYRKAAERRHGGAANNLGACYERGRGVPQNFEKAADWYRKAADQGEDPSREALDRVLSKIKGAER